MNHLCISICVVLHESFVYFRYPVTYSAYFTAGSDPEFSVTPSTGELLPIGSNGSMLRVGFCPSVYGKIHTGKLVIQVKLCFIDLYMNAVEFC